MRYAYPIFEQRLNFLEFCFSAQSSMPRTIEKFNPLDYEERMKASNWANKELYQSGLMTVIVSPIKLLEPQSGYGRSEYANDQPQRTGVIDCPGRPGIFNVPVVASAALQLSETNPPHSQYFCFRSDTGDAMVDTRWCEPTPQRNRNSCFEKARTALGRLATTVFLTTK